MDSEILKYLSDDEKKRIAERVYEEELRRIFQDDVKLRDPSIFHDQQTVYSRILSDYIQEMNLKHEDFVPKFEIILNKEIADIQNPKNTIQDTEENALALHIRWQLQRLATDIIEENKEKLKLIIREKVFKCCNETLLIAFLSDIVRHMNLDKAVKQLIKESEGDKT